MIGRSPKRALWPSIVILAAGCTSQWGQYQFEPVPNVVDGKEAIEFHPVPSVVARGSLEKEDTGTSIPATLEEGVSGEASPLGSYFAARGKDLADIVKFGAGIGIGAHADVEATMLFHFGVGGAISYLYGFDGGSAIIPETVGCFPFTNILNYKDFGWRGMLICHEHCPFLPMLWDWPPDLWYPSHSSALIPLFFTLRDGKFGPPPVDKGYPIVRWGDIEIGVSLLLLGARLGFSPGETVDFVLGWGGLDISGDDDRPMGARRDWHQIMMQGTTWDDMRSTDSRPPMPEP